MLIDGHIINKEDLTAGGWVLDAGCRGFTLSKALGKDYKYLCLDPDKSISPVKGVVFVNKALFTHDEEENYCGWSTGEGNHLYTGECVWYATTNEKVQCVTLKSLMDDYKIDRFELAKIDIEGSEYDLLLSIDFPFTKQLCVEFHCGIGHNKYGTHEEYIRKLMASPFAKMYRIEESYEYPEIKGMHEYLFKLK